VDGPNRETYIAIGDIICLHVIGVAVSLHGLVVAGLGELTPRPLGSRVRRRGHAVQTTEIASVEGFGAVGQLVGHPRRGAVLGHGARRGEGSEEHGRGGGVHLDVLKIELGERIKGRRKLERVADGLLELVGVGIS